MAGEDQKEADAEDKEEFDDEDSSEGKSGKKKLAGKVLILKFVLPALLLIGGAGGAFMSGALDGLLGAEDGAAESSEPEEPLEVVYYDLPEMLVNLSGNGRRTHFLKISVSLELTDPGDIPRLETILPRIIDNFQVYLRELRIEDLQGSAGLYRLREELLLRVSVAAAPAKVHDVLFKEMLIQ
jgi:flagellar FliL protein